MMETEVICPPPGVSPSPVWPDPPSSCVLTPPEPHREISPQDPVQPQNRTPPPTEATTRHGVIVHPEPGILTSGGGEGAASPCNSQRPTPPSAPPPHPPPPLWAGLLKTFYIDHLFFL